MVSTTKYKHFGIWLCITFGRDFCVCGDVNSWPIRGPQTTHHGAIGMRLPGKNLVGCRPPMSG